MKSNIITLAQEKILSAAKSFKKLNGKQVISSEAITGIFFDLNPGLDEINSDYKELCDIATVIGVYVLPLSEINSTPTDNYSVL